VPARSVVNGARRDGHGRPRCSASSWIALANRLNVIESEIVTPRPAEPASTLGDLASTYGVTHLIVGDISAASGELVVPVRLIDAETHIIVAAAIGTVALPAEKESRWFFADTPAAPQRPQRTGPGPTPDRNPRSDRIVGSTPGRRSNPAHAECRGPDPSSRAVSRMKRGCAGNDACAQRSSGLPRTIGSHESSGVEDFTPGWRANPSILTASPQPSVPATP
jgi:hypothetical protein